MNNKKKIIKTTNPETEEIIQEYVIISEQEIKEKVKKYKRKKMIIDKWDADEKARDTRTYDTKENSLEALNHILKQYLLLKNRKIDPKKPLRDAIDLIQNTLYYDKEFHQFALQNYMVYLYYDERNNRLYIGK